MTKAKKAISVVLAVVMIAGLFAFGAFAADQNATIAVSASETQVEVGATVTVTVAATTDYYAAATSVPVYYDAAAFDLVPDSVTPSTDLYGAGYTDTAINTTEAGCVMVAFIPKAGGTAKQLSNTTLFTFQLTAKANAQASPIATKAEDQKTATNIGGKLYLGAYSTADVNTATVTAVGQEFSLTNTAVTIGSAAAPELQLSETGSSAGVIIDRVSNCANGNGFVYGIDNVFSDADILNNLTTPAGSIRVTANESGAYSTGAKIELLDAEGATVETYYYIFFGDINGDSYVDFIDVTSVEGINSFMDFDYMAGDGSCQGMAADINGDSFIDFIDVTFVEGVNSFMDFPTQADTAATVAASKGIS